MCDGGLIIAGIGVALSAYSSYSQSKAQQDSLNYQADMYDNNAEIAENNAKLQDQMAEDATQRGENDAQDHLRKVAAFRGKQETKLAANGLALNEGSPLSLLEDTDFMGNYDADTIRKNAERESWGYRVNATNYRNQGSDLTASGGMYKTQAGAISPGFNALGAGASSVASNWGTISNGYSNVFGGKTTMNATQQKTMTDGMNLYGP